MEKVFENAENVSRLIQLILAPVVMVTACSVMVSGLVNRFAAINDRLRALNHERIELLTKLSDNIFTAERIEEIDGQIPALLTRLKLAHNSVLAIYCAVVIFIIDMLVIALAALSNYAWAAFAALVVFLLGTAIIALGVMLTIREVQVSLFAIEFETKRVAALKVDLKSRTD